MSFKLIAIRPLDNCNPDFLKNLEENRIYKFYNDYAFLNTKDEIIDTFGKDNYINVEDIKHETKIPENLYKNNINVSAIVGKNGSGKSAIIELFIVTLNNLAKTYGFVVNHNGYEDVDYIKWIEKINIEFYFEISNTIYKVKIEEKEKLNIEILKLDGTEFLPFLKNFKEFIQEHFFYTNIINYSIWAYNHHEIGNFITALFHKNDAYQIPIVLNPYRQQGGTFSPETEKELALDRLLYNIFQLTENARKITDELEIINIELELRSNNFMEYEMYRFRDGDKIQQLKFKDFLKGMNSLGVEKLNHIDDIYYALYNHYGLRYDDFKGEEWKIVNEYLLYKVIKIVTRYYEFQLYFDLFNRCFFKHTFEKFLEDLLSDTSHITLKIRQTLNFIKFQNVLEINLYTKEIDPEEYAEKINKLSDENLPLLDLLPPPIFNTELILTNNLKYKNLSSGEKQMIATVQSVLYHIINLNSIKSKDYKIKYRNINLIFEEIELYFHPEYQRVFLNRVIDGIEKLNIKEININLLFVTHSPFILSDIPKQNVLFLRIDEKTKKSTQQTYKGDNTFAENIHQMLTDGFFIKSTKGEFAISKINEFLEFYKKKQKVTRDEFLLLREYYKKVINLIGEDYIRKILQNHFDELDNMFNPDYLENQRDDLRKQLQDVEDKIKIK